MKTPHRLITLFAALTLSVAHGIQPSTLKLFPPTSPGHSGANAGAAVGTSEKYSLVGAPYDGVSFENGGAVHVFDAVTGKRLRTLRPALADGGAQERFGSAVAISGTTALIGAPGDDLFGLVGCGSVYWFDLVTGKQLLKFNSPAASAGAEFGASVAFEGNLAIVGSPLEATDGANAGAVFLIKLDSVAKTVLTSIRRAGSVATAGDTLGTSVAIQGSLGLAGAPGHADGAGAVYLFNVELGEEIAVTTAADGAPNDAFGASVAMCHSLAMIGAPGADTATEELGAVYVSRIDSGEVIGKLTGLAGNVSSGFGRHLAASGNFLLVGAPWQGTGAVHLFHTASGERLAVLTAPDAQTGYEFGSSVAALENVLVVGAVGVDLPGSSNDGAGYLYASLATQLGSDITAMTKAPASEVYDATHSVFTTFSLTMDASPVLYGTLTGAGAVSGTTTALWRSESDVLRLKLRTGDLINGFKITSFVQSLPGDGNMIISQVKGSGTGISTLNDVGIYSTSNDTDLMIQEGDALTAGGFTGEKISVLGQMATGESNSQVAYYTTLKTGTTTVSTSNDSAIVLQSFATPANLSAAREGSAVMGGSPLIGQVTARPSYLRGRLIIPAALATGPLMTITTANNAGLLVADANNANLPRLHAQKGAGAGVGFYSAFLGESLAADDSFIYRATLTGVPIAENEGIWRADRAEPALQKGKANAGLPTGVTISKFLRYWLMNDRQVLALVTLSGTGVTSTNDSAIVRLSSQDFLRVLAREGDYAPGTAGAKYSIIQQMDASPASGLYGFTGLTHWWSHGCQSSLLHRQPHECRR